MAVIFEWDRGRAYANLANHKVAFENATTVFTDVLSLTTYDPERLRDRLAGYWSRRINGEHRIVYLANDDSVFIVQLRYHY